MSGLEGVERIAIVAAMVQELRPIVRALGLAPDHDGLGHCFVGRSGNRAIAAAVTSMGTAAATSVTGDLLDRRPAEHVIVAGIAGGIAPDLSIGDLVVPEVVVDEATGVEARPVAIGGHEARGRMLTTDVLHNTPGALDELRAQGYVAVDMETAAIGAECESRGIPWSAFRAISDRAGDPNVDERVLGLSKADGHANPGAVARYLVTGPWRIPKLARLGRGMSQAVTASTGAVLRVLDLE